MVSTDTTYVTAFNLNRRNVRRAATLWSIGSQGVGDFANGYRHSFCIALWNEVGIFIEFPALVVQRTDTKAFNTSDQRNDIQDLLKSVKHKHRPDKAFSLEVRCHANHHQINFGKMTYNLPMPTLDFPHDRTKRVITKDLAKRIYTNIYPLRRIRQIQVKSHEKLVDVFDTA